MIERFRTPYRLGPIGAALALVLALVAASAVYGGVGLISNGLGMPEAWLERMPGHSWDVGGWALLLTVAVPQAVACVHVPRRHEWAGVVAGVLEMFLAWLWTRPTGLRTAR